MRVTRADTATPVHAVREGDHIRERRTGEVRKVVAIAKTLTERRLFLDDETHIDSMIFNTMYVTTDEVSPACRDENVSG